MSRAVQLSSSGDSPSMANAGDLRAYFDLADHLIAGVK